MIRALSCAVALAAALMLAWAGVARAEAAGSLVRVELQLAPYLAMGGALDDLCEDGKGHCPGCEACDMCCMHLSAPLPADAALEGGWWRLVITHRATRARIAPMLPAAPPGPPVRAPPWHG